MAKKELELSNLKTIYSLLDKEFKERLNSVTNFNFDDPDFIEKKQAEIAETRTKLDSKIAEKEAIIDKEVAILNVELNKDLSASNETIYNANTALEKAQKIYNEKVKEEVKILNEKTNKIELEKEQLLHAHEIRFSTKISDLEEEKNKILDKFQNDLDDLSKKFDKKNEELKNVIALLYKNYEKNLASINEEFDNQITQQNSNNKQIENLNEEINKLDSNFENLKKKFDKELVDADKDKAAAVKKELSIKTKDYESNKKQLLKKINSIKEIVNNGLKLIEKNKENKIKELNETFLKSLCDQDHLIRSEEYQFITSKNDLVLEKNILIGKIEKLLDLEKENSNKNLNIIDTDYKTKILSIKKEHDLNIANIEHEREKVSLEVNKIKTEQSNFRAKSKTKFDYHVNIAKSKCEFAFKNAEAEDVKIIQKSKSDININEAHVNFHRIRANYEITNAFFGLPLEALRIQNLSKSNYFGNIDTIRRNLNTKMKNINEYIDTLIEYNNHEYQNILATLKLAHEKEANQLIAVLNMAKESENNDLIELTTANLADMDALSQQKINLVSENYHFIENNYKEYKKQQQELFEKELSDYILLSEKLNNSFINCNDNLTSIVQNQEKSYDKYLKDFDNSLNTNITKLTDYNTCELERINTTIQENNKELENRLLILKNNYQEALTNLDKENNNAIKLIIGNQKNLEPSLKQKMISITKAAENEINTIKQENDRVLQHYKKMSTLLNKALNDFDNQFKKEAEINKKTLNENIKKSIKIKEKTIKIKKGNPIAPLETNWWRLN